MSQRLLSAPVDGIEFLASTELFRGVERSALEKAAGTIEWLSALGGETLFCRGDAGDSLYLVVSGRLRVVVEAADGSERVLREIGRGGNVGELALLSEDRRSATVRVVRDSLLARISRPQFERLICTHPTAMLSLTRTLAAWLRTGYREQGRGASPSAIALVPLSPEVPLPQLAAALSKALTAQGSTLCVDLPMVRRRFPQIASDETAQISRDEIGRWLDDLDSEYQFLVYRADAESPAWTRQCVREADRVVLVARSRDDVGRAADYLRHLLGDADIAARQELVLLHPDGRTPAGTAAWLALRPFAAHHHVRLRIAADVARLARRLTGSAIGVVLSGGGARGFAHIGVLRALEEAGIPADRIGGTSMGAVIAAQYACGFTPAAMLEMNRLWQKYNPLRGLTLPAISLVSGSTTLKMLEEMFGDVRIEDLWLDYFCVSANDTHSTIAVHREGLLTQWVRSTIAIPGIGPPLRLPNGDLLVDGGVLNNLPVDIMQSSGEGPIIAVDVFTPRELRSDDYVDQPSALQKARLLATNLLPIGTPPRSPTIFHILYRTLLVGSRSMAERFKYEVDTYIEPHVGQFGIFEWSAIESLVDVGYRTARPILAPWHERHAGRESTLQPLRPSRATPRGRREATRVRRRPQHV